MPITTEEFTYICDLVRTKAGIVLEPGKEYLVDARMSGLLRQEKLASVAVVVSRLKASAADPLHKRVVEVMTTNETSFFRDINPFESLKNTIIPELLVKRAATKTLSIWCGAASTGQEPYTIAMILQEMMLRLAGWKITIVATDISSEMIARCKRGTFNQIEINRGLPAALMVKYFEKHGLEWTIRQPLRDMIDFREMNLTTAWPALPTMDIVFLRNVLIYFDQPTKREILGKIRRILRPDGTLFLGCAETTMSLDENYQRLPIEKSSCYRVRPVTAVANAA